MSKPPQPRSRPGSRRVVRHRKLPQDWVSLGCSCPWRAVIACMPYLAKPPAVGEVTWLLTQETGWLFSAGLDSNPQLIERNAVVERGAVDDAAVAQLHEPGVTVLAG